MSNGIQISQSIKGYTKISYNGQEIARHNLSPTTQGTREAFNIPENESVLNWLTNHFRAEIEEIENTDLFEHPELLPREIKELMEKHETDEPTANDLEAMKDEFNSIGYTFDYGLTLEPFNLRKL